MSKLPISEIVKCYNRKSKKKGKSYEIKQCVINLKKDSDLEHEEEILIFKLSEFHALENDHENKLLVLEENLNKIILDLQGQIQNKDHEISQLENQNNHTNARLDKAFKEINTMEQEITRLQNRGFFDYLFRRNKKALNP